MGIAKININGNTFVGAFVVITESFALLASNVTPHEEDAIRENLDVNGVKTSIDGSNLIGIYSVANSHGILVPNITKDLELKKLKENLPNINVMRFNSDLNALRNNILVNDKFAIVDPSYSKKEMDEIGQALEVDVMQFAIGGFNTVGSNNILTNKGMVLTNSASDEDRIRVQSLVEHVSQSTANLGSLSLGLSAVANSKGLIVGKETSGFELARIADGLDL